jgi:hypothetical protein
MCINGSAHFTHSKTGGMTVAIQWQLAGTYFETCNCDVACPCVFLSAPTTGECTVLVGWHIERGAFDTVTLDGLNVALAIHSPGHMAQVKWKAALYLDAQATEVQQHALTQIFTGQAGGHPGPAGAFAQEYTVIRNALSDNKL